MAMEQINSQEKTKVQLFWELVRFALIALIIVIPIRIFVAEPFIVSGSSMVPTFHNGDYLIVDKVSYELGSPKRDDVIVFHYPNDTTKFFIKRIIGLPDDTIDIKGAVITITDKTHPDGFTLDQPFIVSPTTTDNLHYVLDDNQYFVMGDNRNASSDSRSWGPVNRNLIVGKAFLRLLPVGAIDILPGSYNQAE